MLSAGTRLGPYAIVAPLGAGGMGEVYRARDSKLNRDVAIKVLLPAVANDPDRLARFSREAQVLASLNHPNIGHIYGLEHVDGVTALVLELVEGEDLAQRVARGPIPLDEALPIAKQIAEALEAAHEQGIIHRDLKPANIKVRSDGTVKVLDFGLAKAMDSAGTSSANAMNSPTLSMHATQAGIILGTAAYMSPEQARGKTVDRRADIWAFGCVLFEMLTGARAFLGDDVTDTIVSVVSKEPDWSALPPAVPAGIRRLLRRCLEKDPKRRLDSAAAVRVEIDEALTAPVSGDGSSERLALQKAPGARGFRPSVVIAVGLLALVSLAALASVYLLSSAKPLASRFIVEPPDGTTFVIGNRQGTGVAIAPDGRTLAFTARDAAGKTLLWLRPIDSLAAQPLAGTDGAGYPFWSPDSRFVAYFASGKLLKIAVLGGPPQTVTVLNSGTTQGRGGAWSRDGTIVFSGGPERMRHVSSAGGPSTPFREPLGVFPSFLPDGRHFLFYGGGRGLVVAVPSGEASAAVRDAGVWVASLDESKPRPLLAADSGGIYDALSGHLLFVRQGTLLAQKFDPKTLTLGGEPFPVGERVETSSASGLTAFSVSDTGILAYGSGLASAADLQMTWLDRQGKVLGTVGPLGNYQGLDLSPNDRRVAAHRHEADGGDVWLTEVTGGVTSRFTFDASQDNSAPVWSPDGNEIAFGALRGGKWSVYRKSSNGSSNAERLIESDLNVMPMAWAPDGGSFVYNSIDPKTSGDIWMVRLTADAKPTALLHTDANESDGQISPDGKWLAYSSTESGLGEIYVQPFPTGAGKWQVSTNQGFWPRWRRDGRELFFATTAPSAKLFAVDVKAAGSTFEAGPPRELFETGYRSPGGVRFHPYAVSSDGQRFLIPRPEPNAATERPFPVVVLLNWAEGIRK